MIEENEIYALFLMGLCTWRESRGESIEAQRGVLHTILNRASVSAWWNGNKANDVVAVILFPQQFSSFDRADPNSTKFPGSSDAVFNNILLMCIAPGADPTDRATSYYSVDIPEPYWVPSKVFTVQIDAIRFYKEST